MVYHLQVRHYKATSATKDMQSTKSPEDPTTQLRKQGSDDHFGLPTERVARATTEEHTGIVMMPESSMDARNSIQGMGAARDGMGATRGHRETRYQGASPGVQTEASLKLGGLGLLVLFLNFFSSELSRTQGLASS